MTFFQFLFVMEAVSLSFIATSHSFQFLNNHQRDTMAPGSQITPQKGILETGSWLDSNHTRAGQHLKQDSLSTDTTPSLKNLPCYINHPHVQHSGSQRSFKAKQLRNLREPALDRLLRQIPKEVLVYFCYSVTSHPVLKNQIFAVPHPKHELISSKCYLYCFKNDRP